MEGWREFFAAELGAAAALAGLVIVGISINVERILASPRLPGRAAETLVTPTGVLVAATYCLVPDQPDWLLGAELISTGLAMWAVPTVIQVRARRAGAEANYPFWPRILLTQFSSLPFIVAGALMAIHATGAVYWLVPGIVVSLIATVLNAWVLLVEILR